MVSAQAWIVRESMVHFHKTCVGRGKKPQEGMPLLFCSATSMGLPGIPASFLRQQIPEHLLHVHRYIKGKPVDLLFYSRSAHLKLVFDRTRERVGDGNQLMVITDVSSGRQTRRGVGSTDSSPKAGPLNACKKRDYIRKRVSTLLAICGSIPLRTAHFRSVCLIRSRLLFTNFAFFAEPEMEGKTDSWSPEGLDSIEDIEAAIGKMDEERSGSTEVPDVPHQKPSEITMDQQRSSRSSRVVAAAVSLGQKLEQRQEIVRSSQHEWWTYKFAQVTAWVVQILFSLASLLLLVLWIRHVHPEAYVVTFFVMVIAALAYLAKVTGMGDAVIGGRKVPIIRYIDWIATTPLMLFELCMIGGAEKHTFFMVIGYLEPRSIPSCQDIYFQKGWPWGLGFWFSVFVDNFSQIQSKHVNTTKKQIQSKPKKH